MTIKKLILAFLLGSLNNFICAQVRSDRPIELNGGTGNRKVTGLELPVDGTDATNKDYVDNAIAGGSGSPSMVSQESENTMSFPDAVFYCEGLSETGNTDWKIPSLPDLCILRTSVSGYESSAEYFWTAAGGTLFRLSDGYITSPPSYNANYSNTVLNTCCSHKARCVR